MPTDFEPGILPSSRWEHLIHLRVLWHYGDRRPRFNILQLLNPSIIEALNLRLPDSHDLATLIQILSSMGRLRSLAVHTSNYNDPTSSVLSAPFAAAISQTRILHFALTQWPPPQLLSHLPSTLQHLGTL